MTVAGRHQWGVADLGGTHIATHVSRRSRSGWTQLSGFFLVFATWLSLFGPIAPIFMMLGMAGVIASAPQQFVFGLKRAAPILIIGAIAMCSALWSTAPGVSLRYGVQLAITLIAAIALASSLPLGKLLRLFFLVSLTVMFLCILSGRQGASASGPVLIGVLGSKNEMGTLCQLLVCNGACLLFQRGEHLLVKLLSLFGMLLGAVVLIFGFATGAVLSTFMFGGLALVFIIGSRLSSGAKVLLVFSVVILLLPLVVIRGDLENYWEYFVVDVLHKDVGLTGRDYLWAHADRLIAERPILGYGYRSTWLGGSADTIGLLRWAGLSNGAGFHFHDNYRELAVDFGLTGATIVCACLGAGFFRLVKQALSPGLTSALIFFAATAILSVIRAKVEVLIGPFNSSTILLVSTAVAGYLQGGARTLRPVRHRVFRFGQNMPQPASQSGEIRTTAE
ncbi:O-antigen ligase family protein [soil metagenome]